MLCGRGSLSSPPLLGKSVATAPDFPVLSHTQLVVASPPFALRPLGPSSVYHLWPLMSPVPSPFPHSRFLGHPLVCIGSPHSSEHCRSDHFPYPLHLSRPFRFVLWKVAWAHPPVCVAVMSVVLPLPAAAPPSSLWTQD